MLREAEFPCPDRWSTLQINLPSKGEFLAPVDSEQTYGDFHSRHQMKSTDHSREHKGDSAVTSQEGRL